MENGSYKISICGLFASSAVIVYGIIIFYRTFSFDLITVLYALKNLLIAGFIFGVLGLKIGEIIDSSFIKNKKCKL